FGEDATIIEGAETGVESFLGEPLKQGSMVIGQSLCNGDVYVDLSEYDGIEGVATPGISVRFFFNRDAMQGNGLDKSANTDADGKYTFLFSELGNVKFIHLNFVKILEVWRGGQWPDGLESCVVESMNLIPKGTIVPDDPEPVDPLAITGEWFHEWNGYGADAEIEVENPNGIESNIGKDLESGATLLGNGNVPGNTYADLTDYDGIEAEGTPGVKLRLLFNRPSMEGGSAPITECNPVFDEDGKFTFMFSEIAEKEGDNAYPYVHLNAVKTPASWAGGYPEGISVAKVTKFNVIPKAGSAVKAIENAEADAVIYNIYGQRVDESYRGIVIKNGKKYINK
ncbi:MAG: hypothetical protein K2O47_04485, partial [Muribaculaceae bacterium]|nr:hypothetical protein [Muribaculaceae bacterium]